MPIGLALALVLASHGLKQESMAGTWNALLAGTSVPITFKGDGTFLATSPPLSISGDYKFDGKRLTWLMTSVTAADLPKEAEEALRAVVLQSYGKVSGAVKRLSPNSFIVDSPKPGFLLWKQGTPRPNTIEAQLPMGQNRTDIYRGKGRALPGRLWQRPHKPEDLGFSSEALSKVGAKAAEIGSSALFVAYQGQELYEFGDVTRPHNVRSVRKSIMDGLIGTLVGAGKLRPDQTLRELGIDEIRPLNDMEQSAKVSDLLAARSGIYRPAAYEDFGSTIEKSKLGPVKPGEQFFYNNWDFNALGSIYEKTAGQSSFVGFEKSFAKPLGMQDYRLRNMHYDVTPVSKHKAYLFYFSARDLARYGLLFLNRGNWGGKKLLSASWIAESTREHSSNVRGNFGYGYLWWILPKDFLGGYLAAGTGGQFIWVNPELDLVVTHLTRNEGMIAPKEVLLRQFREVVQLIVKAKVGS